MSIFAARDQGHATAYLFHGGAWRGVLMPWLYHAGRWRPLERYRWSAGTWETACSKPCGGGELTRPVDCLDSLGNKVPDVHCLHFADDRPVSTQPCNTQSCSTTMYNRGQPRYFVSFCNDNWSWWWDGTKIHSTSAASWYSGNYMYSRGAYREQVKDGCVKSGGIVIKYATATYYNIVLTQIA